MKKDYTKIVFGAFLLGVAALFLLSSMDALGGVKTWRLIWPLALAAVGTASLIARGSRIFGAAAILVGIWFFIAPFTDIDIDRNIIFAGIIALIGLSVIASYFHSGVGGKSGKNAFILFGGKEEKITDPDYTGNSSTVLFGGYELDLSKLDLTHDIHISLFAMFGGMELYVPENVKLKLNTSAIFGGVENKAKVSESPDAFTIHIDAFTIFGGIEINN